MYYIYTHIHMKLGSIYLAARRGEGDPHGIFVVPDAVFRLAFGPIHLSPVPGP